MEVISANNFKPKLKTRNPYWLSSECFLKKRSFPKVVSYKQEITHSHQKKWKCCGSRKMLSLLIMRFITFEQARKVKSFTLPVIRQRTRKRSEDWRRYWKITSPAIICYRLGNQRDRILFFCMREHAQLAQQLWLFHYVSPLIKDAFPCLELFLFLCK